MTKLARPRLKGMEAWKRRMWADVTDCLERVAAPMLIQYAEDALNSQEQATGQAFPKKKVKYTGSGLDPRANTHFLIKTGAATKMTAFMLPGADITLRVCPVDVTSAGKDVLQYHVPSRVDWLHPLPGELVGDLLNSLANCMKRKGY